MRPLVYYIALTLDGYIAHEDGSFEGFPWDDAFAAELLASFPETLPAPFHPEPRTRADNQHFDAVLMGRKTYDVGLQGGLTSPYPTLDQYVFSRSMTESPDPQVTLVRDNAVDVVRDLKQQPGKAIWLCGGGALAGQLFEAGLIDQLIIKLNPVLFGSGIPLFSGGIPLTALQLTQHKAIASGHVILYYDVQR